MKGRDFKEKKKEIGKTQEANAVMKNGIAEGDHKARTGKEDKLGSEVRTGKGREEMTDKDDGKTNENKTEGGDVVTGSKDEFLGRDVGDELRVKRNDTNTGEEEEEVLLEKVLTAVGVGRWQIPLILTALISKYCTQVANCSKNLSAVEFGHSTPSFDDNSCLLN
ncbi:hypothetical protein Pmani_008699 [Petrolisthes manimaculis]|uniref:Uncharacterized protein n=1 Tax=Petrolisthes manimaculis TaxID=1843537 RepID=A0AAE1Q6F2_9EUCA|nr:hypothetical protein Pmani_008699 [Petrolisthes manimaculis]